MSHTFIGKPVIINHQNATPENYTKLAVGYVTAVRFCPEDAWFYADFIVTDEKAKKCIEEEGYSVSCAYNVLDVKEGGLWHDIKFDGEIVEGSFTHLALVENPRYEESKITKQLPAMLVNGKSAHYVEQKEENEMFKIFKKKEAEKQEDFTSLHVAINGKEIPVTDLIKSYVENKKNEKKEIRMAADEDIVDIDGNAVSIADLKADYAMKKQNEKKEEEVKKDEEKKANEKEKELEKEEKKEIEEGMNEKEEEKKEEKKEEKENSKKEGNKYFAQLENAGKTFVEENENVANLLPLTRSERAARWKEKSNKK
jgi:hypothetical protein